MAVVTIRTQVDQTSLKTAESQIIAVISRINNKEITFKMSADTRKNLNAFSKALTAFNVQTKAATKQQQSADAVEKQRLKTQRDIQVALEKTAQESLKLETQTKKLETAEAKANTSATEGFLKTGDAAAKTGDTIGALVGKVGLWAVATSLVYAPLRAIGEALDTMQAVDDKLVEVRKVTDFTTEQMSELEASAYKVASAYGETADAYLDFVAEFARAGYQEQSDALAELATKVQIVGDVSSETASQFLLAVDAAYQYNGSIEKLSAVLDGANEIDNKYATSIEKLADGMGIVAPVAAQVGVSVEELTAAIGTITAVTQRTGSEAARAFRAIVLNIVGDTTTEIDEGVTWTTGEIAGLKDLLMEYAPAAYKAAAATGSIVDPMEAIGALAHSVEDGILSEAELMQRVTDIGGKLRASQLLALIQNWDMYEQMLADYSDAAGSADKEVENAMNSWTRKLNVLKNTWTEFVTNFVDTDVIKGGLDVITTAVEALDSPLGRIVTTAIALSAAFSALGAILPKIGLSLTDIAKTLASPATGWITGLSAAIVLFGKLKALSDELYVTYEEQKTIVEELNAEYEKQFGSDSEWEDLNNRIGSLTEQEQRRLEVLRAQNEASKEQLRIERQKEFEKRSTQDMVGNPAVVGVTDTQTLMGTPVSITEAEASVSSLSKGYEELTSQWNEGKISQSAYVEGLRELISAEADDVEMLSEYIDAGYELEAEEYELVNAYNSVIDCIIELTDAEEAAAAATDEHTTAALSLDDALSELASLESNYSTLAAAVDEFNQYGSMSAETMQKLIATGFDLDEVLTLTDGKLSINEAALNSMASAAQYAALKALGLSDAEAQVAANAAAAGAAAGATVPKFSAMYNEAIAAANGLDTASAAMEKFALKSVTARVASGETSSSILAEITSAYNGIAGVLSRGTGSSGRSSSGGSSSKKGTDPYSEMKDALDETLDDMEHQIFLWEIKGGMTTAIVEQYRKMQAELHKLAEAYREKGLDENSEYIQKLQEQWQDYEEEIKAISENLWDELETAISEKLKVAETKKEAEVAAIDAQIDALKKTADEEDALLELEEKRLAVAEAQEALLKAQEERTIRIYNAQTGQWEWTANASSIASARETLGNAEAALSDYLKERAQEEEIAALEARKAAIEAQYSAYEQMWETITDSIADPTRDISKILSDISQSGLPAMQNAVASVSSLLLQLGNYGGAAVDTGTGGSISGAAKDYKNDTTDYAALMLSAPDEETFNYFAGERLKKIQAQSINLTAKNWEDNEKLKEMWKTSNIYDSGGILKGLGGIKATERDEMVLPPDLTAAMLTPQSNSMFLDRVEKLKYLFGTTPINITAGATNGGGQSITNNGGSYYIGNVEISKREAETLTIAELARRTRTLTLYAN